MEYPGTLMGYPHPKMHENRMNYADKKLQKENFLYPEAYQYYYMYIYHFS